MRLLFALLWFVAGDCCLYRPKSTRSYVRGLLDSPGNRLLKRQHYLLSVVGVGAVAIGVYQLVRFFRP